VTTETPKTLAKRIVLGVTGGVAAYKAILILRQLMDAGYFVSPVLTPDALHFVGPVTFSALASEPARSSLYGDSATPSPHTYLGQHADLVVVAPATAHFVARLAAGLANDLLSATVLATTAPVLLCPAMHTEMWEHPSVQENLAILRRRGFLIMPPVVGMLAGGDEGAGRLPEPEAIVELARAIVDGYRGPLSGRHVLVSAGGTSEPLDPVRTLTNRSSGHQGYAIAELAARLGAQVTLVSASNRELALDLRRRVTLHRVERASEMASVVLSLAPSADVVIMAAAVSDFTVDEAAQKIKKDQGVPVVVLQATDDIVAALIAQRSPGQVLVAFAAETTQVMDHARRKLESKPVDLLVVNDVSQPGVGFAGPTNAVTILSPDGLVDVVELTSKEAVAERLLTRVVATLTQGA